jgi:hypothetical protein
LEENQSLTATQIRRRAQIQHELLAIIDKEESYWQQIQRVMASPGRQQYFFLP